MTPSYQYAQTGLEDYHHQVVSTASTVPPDGQFKDQPTFSPPTAAAVTANGGVEQQTVRRALQLHDVGFYCTFSMDVGLFLVFPFLSWL